MIFWCAGTYRSECIYIQICIYYLYTGIHTGLYLDIGIQTGLFVHTIIHTTLYVHTGIQAESINDLRDGRLRYVGGHPATHVQKETNE